MCTNYYLKHPDGLYLHIGKSSAGWCFSLHVMPEAGINSLDEWRSLFCDPYALIQDEYGRL
jgi:hypothetical protein